MKRNIILSILSAIIALSFMACSDENEIVNPGIVENDGNITFILPGINKGGISYADPPVASDAENKMDTLNIYVFDDVSKKLEKVFRTDDITFGGSGASRTAKVNMTGREGKKIFYFVGNGNSISRDLHNINVGVTQVSDFIESITDRNVKMPVAPLVMSGKTIIEKVEEPQPDEKKVTLKRRVARFDVDNETSDTNFEIKNIVIFNSNQRAYLFEDALKNPGKTIETGDMPKVAFSDITGANTGISTSVFYLYPTTLGTGKTQISFEGVFNGEEKIYNLNLENDVEVDPNKRYILKAKKVPLIDIDFTLQIEDWNVGEEYETQPETELVTFGSIEIKGGTGMTNVDNNFDLTGLSAATKINFKVTSYNKDGVKVETKYKHGGPTTWNGLKINNPTPVLTYSAHYEQDFEIDIPLPNPKVPLEVSITLINVVNPDQKETFTFYANRYPGTELYPVLFGGLYWAPVNVGATTIDGFFDTKDMGLFYQWGRNNYGHTYGTSGDIHHGPVTMAVANSLQKFIANSFDSKNWASDNNNALWVKTGTGPCPAGWRVSEIADLNKIKEAFDANTDENKVVVWESPYLKIKGTNAGVNSNEILCLPAAGYRVYNGDWEGRNTPTGVYWSGDSAATSSWLSFSPTTVNSVQEAGRANGASVRCVKQTPTF